MSARIDAHAVETLPFLVAVDEQDDAGDTMGLFKLGDREVAVKNIPVAVLKKNVQETISALRQLFDDLAEQGGRLRLTEAQFSFEVSAKGGLNLIGTTEIGSKGAITLTFGE